MTTEWVPRNKYEVAPGLFVGSEMGDINRETKVLMKKWLNGDQAAAARMKELRDRRIELLTPKRLKSWSDI